MVRRHEHTDPSNVQQPINSPSRCLAYPAKEPCGWDTGTTTSTEKYTERTSQQSPLGLCSVDSRPAVCSSRGLCMLAKRLAKGVYNHQRHSCCLLWRPVAREDEHAALAACTPGQEEKLQQPAKGTNPIILIAHMYRLDCIGISMCMDLCRAVQDLKDMKTAHCCAAHPCRSSIMARIKHGMQDGGLRKQRIGTVDATSHWANYIKERNKTMFRTSHGKIQSGSTHARCNTACWRA